MATADWFAWSIAFAPLLQWTLERVYDTLTSRKRRIWWQLHYHKIATAYIANVKAQRDFEAERREFERFHMNCRALVAGWQCQEFRMVA